MKDPRETYLDMRRLARDGQTVYDGNKFMVSFPREVQDRIEGLAGKWRVPRAEMVRYLVAAALELVEALPTPQEDQEEEEVTNEDTGTDPGTVRRQDRG